MKPLLWIVYAGLLLISAGCSTAKKTTTDDHNEQLIMWKAEQPLVWTDFRGTAEPGMDWSAVTNSFIGYRNVEKNKVWIGAYFDRQASWCVQKREDLLKHEQYHFNITECCARELRKAVIAQQLNIKTDAFKNLYREFVKKCGVLQKEYDDATHHGKLKDEQAAQERKIDETLEALAAFADQVIRYR